MPEGTSFNLTGPQQSSHHVRRTGTLGLYECSDNDFTGKCHWTIADGGACHLFKHAGGVQYPKSVSAGPDKGLSCNFFFSLDCSKWMNYEGVLWPGIKDTMNSKITKPEVNNEMGTKHNWALSYQCHPILDNS